MYFLTKWKDYENIIDFSVFVKIIQKLFGGDLEFERKIICIMK